MQSSSSSVLPVQKELNKNGVLMGGEVGGGTYCSFVVDARNEVHVDVAEEEEVNEQLEIQENSVFLQLLEGLHFEA